ncbi:MAG: hypothetical protein M3Y35_05480 [Actinomycetota bacterium]|nr:hypothetical protein [Actinomycetota bacterium]
MFDVPSAEGFQAVVGVAEGSEAVDAGLVSIPGSAGSCPSFRVGCGVVELAVGGARRSQPGKVHVWSRMRAANAVAGLGM